MDEQEKVIDEAVESETQEKAMTVEEVLTDTAAEMESDADDAAKEAEDVPAEAVTEEAPPEEAPSEETPAETELKVKPLEMPESVPGPASVEFPEIKEFLNNMKLKSAVFGFKKEDVYEKMRKLNKLYQTRMQQMREQTRGQLKQMKKQYEERIADYKKNFEESLEAEKQRASEEVALEKARLAALLEAEKAGVAEELECLKADMNSELESEKARLAADMEAYKADTDAKLEAEKARIEAESAEANEQYRKDMLKKLETELVSSRLQIRQEFETEYQEKMDCRNRELSLVQDEIDRCVERLQELKEKVGETKSED